MDDDKDVYGDQPPPSDSTATTSNIGDEPPPGIASGGDEPPPGNTGDEPPPGDGNPTLGGTGG